MSFIVPRVGTVRRLDRDLTPDDQVTEEQVKDRPRLARLLTTIVRDVRSLKRRWRPRVMDFEDRSVDATGTKIHRFEHGLNARVRWWVIGWSASSGAPSLRWHPSSDANTLCLVSDVAGTMTLRVEAAG